MSKANGQSHTLSGFVKLQEEPPVKNQKRDDFLHLHSVLIQCLWREIQT